MRIAVIEDHKLVRDMLLMSCRKAMPKASVSGANTAAEGVALAKKEIPDIIFLDLALPDGDGLDFVPQLKAAAPASRIIVLTSHADEYTLHRALQLNVNGFVDKNEQPLEVLQEAIATVMAGQQYFSSMAQRIKTSLQTDPVAFSKLLTDREQELLRYFGEGMTNEQMADKLGIDPITIKAHRRNIMGKLNLHSSIELVHYALEKGFARLKQRPA